jgi:two-component system KDP operon response regulator KdpE
MAGLRILLVDDEVAIQRTVAPFLRSQHCEVAVVRSGAEALKSIERDPPDLIVLDMGLPDMDGTEVCRRIREKGAMPIIILSARNGEPDKVAALDMGANDYVTKPFDPEDLRSRVHAWLRHPPFVARSDSGSITLADLAIDCDGRHVLRGNKEIELTPKEFDLLTFLAHNADRVLTNGAILKGIGEPNEASRPEHLWVMVSQLRKKIEPDPTHPRYIISESWVGYRLATEIARPGH